METEQSKRGLEQKVRAIIVGILAPIMGYGSWLISLILWDRPEAWDSPIPGYYTFSIGGAGFICGVISPCKFLIPYLGVWFGQVLASGTLPGIDKSWLYLGVITTAIGSVIALFGLALGYTLVRALRGKDK